MISYDDIMDMLTDHEYSIDYTGDADGAAETFGQEAGHGIISASKMLAWVARNCAVACPGKSAMIVGTRTAGYSTKFGRHYSQ